MWVNINIFLICLPCTWDVLEIDFNPNFWRTKCFLSRKELIYNTLNILATFYSKGSMHWIVSNNLRNVILVTIYYSGRHVNCQTNITNKLRQITVCSKNVSCRPWHIARRLRYLICCEMITDDVWFVLLRVISF